MRQTYITPTGEIIISEKPGMKHFLSMTDHSNSHTMIIDKIAVNELVTSGAWKLKNSEQMTKLEFHQQQHPDAVEYQKKNQSYIREDQARLDVYGKEVNAKVLFYRDIPSTTGVTQHYIFSVQAAKECKL